MEGRLIANITRLLARGSIGSANWQAEKLAELGTLESVNKKVIQKELSKAIEAAQLEIASRSVTAANVIDSAVKIADALPPGANEALRSVMEVYELKIADEFNRVGATLINSARSIYIDTVETTTAQVLAGQITVRQAIAEAASGWARSGIPGLIDKADRQWSAEAYAQMLVRTNVRRAVTDTQLTRMEQLDLDLVEVSSHAGARPGCAPYQGKFYSLNGKTRGYPLLSSTSYGEPAGLFGINCGHTMYPHILGTHKTYKRYPVKENEKVYEESQAQRKLERGIRQAKRELAVQQALGDSAGIERAKELVSNRQAAMRELVSDTGRTRRYDREQIYR
jgi:hypothetical protein